LKKAFIFRSFGGSRLLEIPKIEHVFLKMALKRMQKWIFIAISVLIGKLSAIAPH
jgi:hypothetical protein